MTARHHHLCVLVPAQGVRMRHPPAPFKAALVNVVALEVSQLDLLDVVIDGVAEAEVRGAQKAVVLLGALPTDVSEDAGGFLVGGQGRRTEADRRHNWILCRFPRNL